jgi:hypothetical protein
MGYVFAMTIPGLAIVLVILGLLDVVLFRRSGSRLIGPRRARRAAPTAYDEAAAFFAPGKRIELEARQSEALMRETFDDGAPPTTEVDLEAGTARIRPARAPRVQADDQVGS